MALQTLGWSCQGPIVIVVASVYLKGAHTHQASQRVHHDPWFYLAWFGVHDRHRHPLLAPAQTPLQQNDMLVVMRSMFVHDAPEEGAMEEQVWRPTAQAETYQNSAKQHQT